MRKFYLNGYRFLKDFGGYYEGDGGGNSPPPPPPSPPAPTSKTFTQDQVNAMMSAEKKKYVAELNKLKESEGLSKTEVEKLQTQITELESTFMTKAELSEREFTTKQKEFENNLKKSNEQAQFWQSNYNNLMINNAITQGAVETEAFSIEQMQNLLGGQSKVVPVLEGGKETGKFEVRVTFNDVDSEGKPITLNLTPIEAMKRMKELPNKYGNLFKSGVNGGLGGGNSGGSGGSLDLETAASQGPAAYRAARAKQNKS